MIVDLYDAIDRMLWALVFWIAVAAAIATPVLLGVAWAVTWAVKRAWRAIATTGPRNALDAPLAAEQPAQDPESPGAAERISAPQPRPHPSWARTDKDTPWTTARTADAPSAATARPTTAASPAPASAPTPATAPAPSTTSA